MEKMKVTARTQTITQNTTLMPEGYGGWFAQNIGTGNVEVDGFVLQEGESIDMLNISACEWGSPIPIVITQVGGKLRIMRLQYANQHGE